MIPRHDFPAFRARADALFTAIDTFADDKAGEYATGLALERDLDSLFHDLHRLRWLNRNQTGLVQDHLGPGPLPLSLDRLVLTRAERADRMLAFFPEHALRLRTSMHACVQRDLPARIKAVRRCMTTGDRQAGLDILAETLRSHPDHRPALDMLEEIRRAGGWAGEQAGELLLRYDLRPDAAPDIVDAFPVFCLAYDGAGTLYLSSFHTETWKGTLSLCRPGDRAPTRFTGDDTVYVGLWFDKKQQLLYALAYMTGQRRDRAIDVFDARGGHLRRIVFPDALRWLEAPVRIQGDEEAFYMLHGEYNGIVKLSRTNLAAFDFLDFDEVPHISSFIVAGKGILATHRGGHAVSTCDVRTGRLRQFAGYDTLFCTLGVQTVTGDDRYAISCDGEPHGHDNMVSWLSRYDTDFHVLYRHRLGACRPLDMAVLDDRGLLAIADWTGKVSFFGIGSR